MSDVSKNEYAAAVLGLRATGPMTLAIDLPWEMGYRCPVCCAGKTFDAWAEDERLHWSEYNGFVWCEVCNRDYPAPLCLLHDLAQATEIFLMIVDRAAHMTPALQAVAFPKGYGLPAHIKAAYERGPISFEQAVREDKNMTDEQKAVWLDEFKDELKGRGLDGKP